MSLIRLKTSDEIEKMRVAGKVAALTLELLTSHIQPGTTTKELDQIAYDFIISQNCTPGCLNYHEYPNSICTSVNDEVVHCLPSDRILQDGDIITVDLSTVYQGFYSDTAKTYLVGNVKPEVQKFVEIGYQALLNSIKYAKDGNYVADISNFVFDFVTQNKYNVVGAFVGHGIGQDMHEEPQIPNTKLLDKGHQLTKGMVICIEPILTMGSGKIKSNGRWNVLSEDGSLAVHFEHMVYISDKGPIVLTKRADENFVV